MLWLRLWFTQGGLHRGWPNPRRWLADLLCYGAPSYHFIQMEMSWKTLKYKFIPKICYLYILQSLFSRQWGVMKYKYLQKYFLGGMYQNMKKKLSTICSLLDNDPRVLCFVGASTCQGSTPCVSWQTPNIPRPTEQSRISSCKFLLVVENFQPMT